MAVDPSYPGGGCFRDRDFRCMFRRFHSYLSSGVGVSYMAQSGFSPEKGKRVGRKKIDQSAVIEGLRQENEALRAQLDRVVKTATDNEKIWRHFAEIEKILFRTRELDRLVEELLREIKGRFQPDRLILLICHPDILERFFPEISMDDDPLEEGTWLLPFPTEAGRTFCAGSSNPQVFSSENIGEFLELLPDEVSSVRSGVLVPLSIHQVFFGGLFLGSLDAGRYRPRDATDLLEQLGIKIALCMDNCLTYEKVRDFAIQDPLTGLLNFFQIHVVLEREFRRAKRSGSPLSAMMIDLNFVHEFDGDCKIGNEILRHAARLLQEVLPARECFLGRYGSDDFVVLLPNVDEDEAREVIPYLTQTIRKSPFKHQNAAVLIQAVIGVGAVGEKMERPRDLLDAAYADLVRRKMKRFDAGK